MSHVALLAVACALVLTQVGIAGEPTPQRREWTIDGVTREAMVSVPDGAATSESPLVFVFHGHAASQKIASRVAITKCWPAAIAVYMQGLPTPGRTDPEGKRSGWQRTVGDQSDRD